MYMNFRIFYFTEDRIMRRPYQELRRSELFQLNLNDHYEPDDDVTTTTVSAFRFMFTTDGTTNVHIF